MRARYVPASERLDGYSRSRPIEVATTGARPISLRLTLQEAQRLIQQLSIAEYHARVALTEED